MLSASRAQTSSRNSVRAWASADVAGELGELAVAPVAAGESEQHEPRRQQTAVGQVVDRRDQLLAGQVAGDAEHDQRARVGHARQPAVARIAQRVAPAEQAHPSLLRPQLFG